MKTTLRVVAVFLGFFVFRLALSIVQEASSGQLTAWWQSGDIRSDTVCFWVAMLILGPVATVQLWRLRRIGLSAAALLGALWLVLDLYGLFHRQPGERVEPFIPPLVMTGALVALSVSPAARRACRDDEEGRGVSRLEDPERTL